MLRRFSVLFLIASLIITIPINYVSSLQSDTNVDLLIKALENQKFDLNKLPNSDKIIDTENTNFTILSPDLKMGENEVKVQILQYENFSIFQEDLVFYNDKFVDGRYAIQNFDSKASKPWTNAEIPLAYGPNLIKPVKDKIAIALGYILTVFKNEGINIKFKDAKDDGNGGVLDKNYILFKYSTNPRHCYATAPPGMHIFTPNEIILNNSCKPGIIVHEILHSLGIWHEQTRCDKVGYIKIDEKNIISDYIDQYNALCDPSKPDDVDKSPLSPESGFYDYCSIMHYPLKSNGFAIDRNKPVMIPTEKNIKCDQVNGSNMSLISPTNPPQIKCTEIGQRCGFSEADLKGISYIYKDIW